MFFASSFHCAALSFTTDEPVDPNSWVQKTVRIEFCSPALPLNSWLKEIFLLCLTMSLWRPTCIASTVTFFTAIHFILSYYLWKNIRIKWIANGIINSTLCFSYEHYSTQHQILLIECFNSCDFETRFWLQFQCQLKIFMISRKITWNYERYKKKLKKDSKMIAKALL